MPHEKVPNGLELFREIHPWGRRREAKRDRKKREARAESVDFASLLL
jgi:hypothetical protein